MIDDRAIQFFLPGGRRSAIALNGRTGGCCGVCAAFDGFLAALLGLFTDKYQPPNVFTVPDRGLPTGLAGLTSRDSRLALPGELGCILLFIRHSVSGMSEKNNFFIFTLFPTSVKNGPANLAGPRQMKFVSRGLDNL